MQMDADDDEPLNRGIHAGSEQARTDSSKANSGQTDSHPTVSDGAEQQRPEAPIATATDLALEQDA